MTNKQVYEKVNEKIMDLISKGTMPWEMTWEGSTLPMNLASKAMRVADYILGKKK